MTKHITFLDRGTFADSVEWPTPAFAHTWENHHNSIGDERFTRTAGKAYVLTNKVIIDADLIQRNPQLELVAVTATGVNNVDLDACKAAGVHVCNAQGYARDAVPEWVLAQLLALAQNQTRYRAVQTTSGWVGAEFFHYPVAPIREIGRMTIGILGKGAIGEGVAKRLQAFGSDVRFLEHPGRFEARAGYHVFTTVLGQLDALILCCPLTADNAELVSTDLLQRLKPGAYVINPSRGGLVNESALVAALRSGHLGGAALDVASAEPLRADNPLNAVRDLPNFILTPHIAWSSQEAMTTLMHMTVENLNRFYAGERNFCLV
ncbi:glycerate dehydrogenase [Salinispirillum sp. LH 10-3-1]|uniref:Glycerate dehydrogenase n=1 Tax=Salinispirillum sp. LH 10-3-1 TaxID=2952525 RepID=A0AB38YHP7_9GAMM